MSAGGTYAPARASRSEAPELHPGPPLHRSQRPTPITSVRQPPVAERKVDNVELLALSTNTSKRGSAKASLCGCGGKGWLNTTTLRALLGLGRVSTERWSKRLWRKRPSAPTPRIGEKKGSKRSLLVDANGIPLSIVASGAQVHDVKLLEPTLDQIVVKRPPAQDPPKENLCADNGYTGQPAKQAIEKRHYVPHVRGRGEEKEAKRRNSRKRARRWVVERTHSWLNRYRKLLVRFEKTLLSFEGLLELACALIVFRRTIVIYG
jgi:transposase